MGWWTEHVVPRIVDKTCGIEQLRELRARLCADLEGDVVELGFGSGLNCEHYPPAVGSVAAIEPSDVAWRMAGPRVAASGTDVRRAGLDGQRLDASDATYDGVLCTFTMCTIPDLDRALTEVVRVLRPGGRLYFLEHGRSPEPRVQKWQDRLTPLQRRVGGGCHLNRRIDTAIQRAGLRIESLENPYVDGPRPFSYLYLGHAVRLA